MVPIISASFVCGIPMDKWFITIHRLRDIPVIQIVEMLKISWHGLDLEGELLFLDIACFLREVNKDMVMVMLDVCYLHFVIKVNGQNGRVFYN